MIGQSAAPGKAANVGTSIIALSRHAAARWQRIYGDLDNAGIATALRAWAAWRDEQIVLNPAHAGRITEIFEAATAWLRAEVQRRLTPKPPGPWVTTAQLVARYGDRLQPAGNERWRCACPWHNDSRPSLIVYPDGWCHCFACGEHRPVANLAGQWNAEAAA